jgi:hypothetical protein
MLLFGSFFMRSHFVNAQNLPPAVAITFPVSYQTYIEGPMTITATASDPDGTIARVVFYFDNDSIGQDLTAPYSFAYYMHPKPEEGAKWYVKARAYDNEGIYTEENIPFFITANTCSFTIPETSRQIICAGDSVHIGTEASTGAIAVQWYRQTGEESWAAIEGDTIHSYYARQTGNYRAVWTYTNTATCTTAVDSVSTLTIDVPMVYTYGGQPALATVLASGGAENYTYNWTGHDSCLNAACDSVLISDFLNPIVVTVTDQMSCVVSDTVEIDLTQLIQDDTPFTSLLFSVDSNYVSKIGQVEEYFQNFMEANPLDAEDVGLNKNFPGPVITIPIVFAVINNPTNIHAGPDSLPHLSQGTINGGIKTNFKNKIKGQIDELNARFTLSPVQINGVNHTIQFCLASKDDFGNPLDSIGVLYYDSASLSYFNSAINTIDDSTTSYTNEKRPFIPQKCLPDFDSLNPLERKFNYCGWYDRMRLLNRFSYRKYLRVVVCDIQKFLSYGNFTGPSGFATTPSVQTFVTPSDSIRQLYDGIILNSSDFSGGAGGRVLVHEVGHWLDLQHTYQNFCEAYTAEINNQHFSPITGGPLWDFIKDTPVQKKNLGAETSLTPTEWKYRCSPTPTFDSTSYYAATPLLHDNHMDTRTNDKRTNFTQEQRERMFYALSYFRNQLYTVENLFNAGVACAAPVAAFNFNKNSVCSKNSGADSVVVTPLNQSGATYAWSVSPPSTNISIQTGTDASPKTIRFNTPKTIGDKQITVTCSVTVGGTTRTISQPMYVYSDCDRCLDPSKKNLFFGNFAGLQFENENLQPGPALGAYASSPSNQRIQSQGGGASISDDLGNLLFYASGSHLWNKNHKRIDVSLYADSNSFQFGIAAKAPDYSTSNQVYYLFTVPAYQGANFANGLRWHKINVSEVEGVNKSAPETGTSAFNIPIPPPPGGPTGNNGAALVSEKITLVPKTGTKDYFLIVQGPATDSLLFGRKFYTYLVGTDTISFVDTSNAIWPAQKGILKISPIGNVLLSTTSKSLDMQTGFAKGPFPRVFRFNTTSGNILPYRELVTSNTDTAVTSISAFGGAFSPNGNYLYINMNRANRRQINPFPQIYFYSGIYKFSLVAAPLADTNKVQGTLVSRLPPGTFQSVALSLAANNTILFSNPTQQNLFAECCPNLSFGNTNLGIIHFPDNYTTPGYTSNGPALTTNPVQNIRSRVGLPNFSDALPKAGQKQTDAIDLGTNPTTCCGYPVYTQGVECTDNDNGTGGNDFYYTFRVDSICGPDYPGVVIKTCGTEFPVNTKIWAKQPNGEWSVNPLDTSYYMVSNCSGGNGQEFEFLALIEDNFISTLFKRPFEFLVEVEAQSPSASGDFKTEIQIQEDYEYFDGFDIVACELPVSCCRKAVDEGLEKSKTATKIITKKPTFQLVPNPAKENLTIKSIGFGLDATMTLTDVFGRNILEQLINENTELDVRSLAKGIYRVRIRDSVSVIFKTLVIE